jgi:hypothetical protein
MIGRSIRGGFVPAAVLILLAGCTGGGSVAPSSTAPHQISGSDKSSAATFEKFRAAAEAQARRVAPAGYQVSVGSTYVTKDHKAIYGDATVVLKTADKIGFQAGSTSVVFRRSELDEFPGTSIVTRPGGKTASYISHGCTDVDNCPPQPDPTDPPAPPPPPDDWTPVLTVSTDAASALAAQRGLPCTQSFSVNYAGATMSYSTADSNTWTLTYRPGYPFYIGLDTEYKSAAVSLVDGTIQQVIVPSYTVPTDGLTQASVIYFGSLLNVRIAQLAIIDYAYENTNQIEADATVSCVNDGRLHIGFNYPVPPHPM